MHVSRQEQMKLNIKPAFIHMVIIIEMTDLGDGYVRYRRNRSASLSMISPFG